jgi:3,4-dihydroxy 2-butanone 4-phosphate synthase/GTP cyclohydrolase II
MTIHKIEDIIEDIQQGKMVVMMDDEDRENEGDLIMAAEKVTPAHINFMMHHARGLVCLPLAKAHCERLQLPLMVRDSYSNFMANFTISIEAAKGVTTGVSAQDRAHTILTATKPEACAQDISQPGHVFPIMAQPGGVLVRAGHTEASVDLARLAGCHESAVICEVLNEDGTMARRPQLEQFAKTHGLKLGTIADLIRYRLKTEPTLKEISRTPLPTSFGRFDLVVFQDVISLQSYRAIVCGKPQKQNPAWVRVHLQDPLLDIPFTQWGSKERWTLDKSLQWIAKAGEGAVVLLEQPSQPTDVLLERILALTSTTETKLPETVKEEWRLIGVGSQILSLLGFGKIRLLGPKKHYCALSGFDLEVVEYLPFNSQLLHRREHHGAEVT